MPWLEPDILDYMEEIAAKGIQNFVIAPIGFISDHMEVLFDLDTEAVAKAEELGMRMQRAATVGIAKPFVSMIVELILERMSADYQSNFCTVDCCLPR
jgi:ferrochelatase